MTLGQYSATKSIRIGQACASEHTSFVQQSTDNKYILENVFLNRKYLRLICVLQCSKKKKKKKEGQCFSHSSSLCDIHAIIIKWKKARGFTSQISLCDFWDRVMAGTQKSFWKWALTCGRDFYSWQHQWGPVQRGQLIPGTGKAKWEKHTIPLLIDHHPKSLFLDHW